MFLLILIKWMLIVLIVGTMVGVLLALCSEPYHWPTGHSDGKCHDHCQMLPCQFCKEEDDHYFGRET